MPNLCKAIHEMIQWCISHARDCKTFVFPRASLLYSMRSMSLQGAYRETNKLPHARTEIWMLGRLKLKTQAIWSSICSMLKHVTIHHHITATNAITCANCAGKIHSFVALESVRSSRRGSPNPRAAPQVSGANFVPHMTWTTWIPNKGTQTAKQPTTSALAT